MQVRGHGQDTSLTWYELLQTQIPLLQLILTRHLTIVTGFQCCRQISMKQTQNPIYHLKCFLFVFAFSHVNSEIQPELHPQHCSKTQLQPLQSNLAVALQTATWQVPHLC